MISECWTRDLFCLLSGFDCPIKKKPTILPKVLVIENIALNKVVKLGLVRLNLLGLFSGRSFLVDNFLKNVLVFFHDLVENRSRVLRSFPPKNLGSGTSLLTGRLES